MTITRTVLEHAKDRIKDPGLWIQGLDSVAVGVFGFEATHPPNTPLSLIHI